MILNNYVFNCSLNMTLPSDLNNKYLRSTIESNNDISYSKDIKNSEHYQRMEIVISNYKDKYSFLIKNFKTPFEDLNPEV
jgi:hypothetical protein